ncbi:helix-turn-helix domain-containing protein [Actinotalea solisilvae]|uniref:helix-turn-helix domain-containing protein n=1 Tax=Actinotalea solisilvae TaxID=2072922 RepID=UPI0018F154A4|nr:helix-turn-helix domain-containing protein [Actinotalea solisilvae]
MTAKLPKGSRITGEGRQDLAASLVDRYNRGESIRAMAEDIGRSYGFVHGVLVEQGVTMRTRGGATRGAAAEARRAALKQGRS